MSLRPECIEKVVELTQDETTPGFTRIKAIEAVGRLRASAASAALQHILEAKQVWRWTYPTELRIAAAQAFAEDRAKRWQWRRFRRAGWTGRNW